MNKRNLGRLLVPIITSIVCVYTVLNWKSEYSQYLILIGFAPITGYLFARFIRDYKKIEKDFHYGMEKKK